jgi:beta-galactosidase
MLAGRLGIPRAVKGTLPAGCTAQVRTDGENNYVIVMNFTPEQKMIDIGNGGESLVSGAKIRGSITLPPWGYDIYAEKR